MRLFVQKECFGRVKIKLASILHSIHRACLAHMKFLPSIMLSHFHQASRLHSSACGFITGEGFYKMGRRILPAIGDQL
jgi:hypothetical protein